MLCFVFTSTEPDRCSIGSLVTFQSDGTPLLQLQIQVKVDSGMLSLL